jgi:GTPase
MDLRVAVIGNVDSGKSTLIGTLSKGDLDDGRGLARKAVLRHQHEQVRAVAHAQVSLCAFS